MEIKVKYKGLAERKKKIATNEAQGLRMKHDNFAPDWKPGDEFHGTMTFTDFMPSAVEPEPVRDLEAEIDELKQRVNTLERGK